MVSSSLARSAIKLLQLNEYCINKAWESSFVCPHVFKFSLPSYVINLPGSPLPFDFSLECMGRAWNKARVYDIIVQAK